MVDAPLFITLWPARYLLKSFCFFCVADTGSSSGVTSLVRRFREDDASAFGFILRMNRGRREPLQ